MAVRRAKSKKSSKLKRVGVSGFNKPKRTPNHRTKSHVVVAKAEKQRLYDLDNRVCQEQENLQKQWHKEKEEPHSKLVTPKI